MQMQMQMQMQISDIDNLLLNMSAGLLPENLNEDEVSLLEKVYGSSWFTILGYYEPEYKNPVKKIN